MGRRLPTVFLTFRRLSGTNLSILCLKCEETDLVRENWYEWVIGALEHRL